MTAVETGILMQHSIPPGCPLSDAERFQFKKYDMNSAQKQERKKAKWKNL